MSDGDLERVTRGVSKATALTSLELDCCDVTTNGAMLLSLLLKGHASLAHLSLNADPYKRPFVSIGCVGVIALCRGIGWPSCKLRTLRCVSAAFCARRLCLQ